MPYKPIQTLTSQVVALRIANIDTDQIIPARFLKVTDKEGFGEKLFYDWRYQTDGTPNPEFVLNQPGANGKILLAGANFGCGSSREHAVWALYGYGFQVVISSGFADIFKSNAMNNGILPIDIESDNLNELFRIYSSEPEAEWTIDLHNQRLIISDNLGVFPNPKSPIPNPQFPIYFEIDPFRKQCLLNGLDCIDYLVDLKPAIVAFEEKRKNIGGAALWSTE